MMRGPGHSVYGEVGRCFRKARATGASDEQLLSRFTSARDHSSAAFEAIVQRHGPMVLETCRRLLGGDPHAAEDAFQATFMVLARRADAINSGPSGSLGPWLHEVACRTARKARVAGLRREKRERRTARDRETTVAESSNDVDELDDYRVLHEEVTRLPAKHRAAVVLCYFEGLTHDQAAASLRWPVGTVRGYLARARDRLRTRLIRRGVVPAVAVACLEARASAAVPPLLMIQRVLRGIPHFSAGPAAAARVSLAGRLVVSADQAIPAGGGSPGPGSGRRGAVRVASRLAVRYPGRDSNQPEPPRPLRLKNPDGENASMCTATPCPKARSPGWARAGSITATTSSASRTHAAAKTSFPSEQMDSSVSGILPTAGSCAR